MLLVLPHSANAIPHLAHRLSECCLVQVLLSMCVCASYTPEDRLSSTSCNSVTGNTKCHYVCTIKTTKHQYIHTPAPVQYIRTSRRLPSNGSTRS
jgi:hypothetical protein